MPSTTILHISANCGNTLSPVCANHVLVNGHVQKQFFGYGSKPPG